MRITILGAGSWGTALAHLAADKGLETLLLARDASLAEEINTRHENSRYLPGLPLCPALRAVTDPAVALAGADIVLLAVPCQYLRESLVRLAPLLPDDGVFVCASKGIELGTLKRMSEVTAEALPGKKPRYAILSGPSFAREVVQGKPSAVVLGCADAGLGEELRAVFSTPAFRVYSSTDVAGVEFGGAIKNVMAIAAGLCDGLELGHNARAALITRGLAEMSRLGEALGARAATFMGLSGLGDLVLTCTGDLSRNRQVGLRLATGESIGSIAASMRMVAEGVKTTEAVCELAAQMGVELPLAFAVRQVLGGTAPLDALRALMSRALREE
ncbi:MAG: NAD(P)-dependent glycerol-3-phosphate dehydrogenase [Desulfovibrionaceae bacterium]|nr:NAD(P)-dependent glycerol-3-phosphate dehydrogenase [Desulfovibrionaceae bacterium]